MSESEQFRRYAAEALVWASQSETEEDKHLLLDLVATWALAALVIERPLATSSGATLVRAAGP